MTQQLLLKKREAWHRPPASLRGWMLALGFMLSTLCAMAQERTTGTIRDDKGQPLPGVTVQVKGTNTTAVTSSDGTFSITAPTGATLVVSSIGFASREVSLTDASSIQLTAQSGQLNEVVIIGYQTVRKRDLTGATTLVNTQNAQKTASRSLPEQLQGLSPGVAVRTGGAPGQEAVVNIRGLSTLQGNGNPLYVIDGVFSDPNTTVNPNDVESIQILKDASAAAIYGSRAGNGVIIITTKRGKEGPLKIGASAKYSVSMVPNTYDMMNATEYVATAKTAYANSGIPVPAGIASYNGATNTDWADLILRRGNLQDYNISLSGGSRNSSVFVSGSYLRDEGTLLGHNFERMALRVNSDASRGRFKIAQNLMISNSNRHSPQQGNFEVGNPWYDLFNNLPIIPVTDPSFVTPANPTGYGIGSPTFPTFSRNPVAINDLWNVKSNFVKILGNVYLDFRLLNSLTYRLNVAGETSLDRTQTVRKVGIFYQNQSEKPSSLEESRGQFLNTMIEHTLSFNKKFGNNHTISAVAGLSDQMLSDEFSVGSRTNLASYGGTTFTTLNSATGAQGSLGASGKTLINSYFGRVNYNFSDRYLASFTFRSDKSSLFSPAFRRGYFPSGALAWNISNEEFFGKEVVNNLKLRVSYGILGLGDLGRYRYTGTLNQAQRAIFGMNQSEFTGGTQAQIVAGELKWEEKATTNIGVDAGFLNNKITASLDLFRSKSEDVLVNQPIPGYLGSQGSPAVNIGSIENKGIELELAYRPQQSGDFRWNVAANFSVIRNKILELGSLGVDPVTGQARNYISSGNTRSQVGRSIGEYFVLQTDGLFQSADEVTKHRAQSGYARPGDIRYVNTVDDGTNDDINDKDRVFAGSPFPKFTTGLQANVSYKAFTLSMQLYGAFGQKLYNDVRRDLESMLYSNYIRGLNYWTPTNTNTNTPRLGVASELGIQRNVAGNSDRWIENGSYLRMRNLELGFMLPKSFLDRLHFSDSRIYISGQNLFTITKYSGLDPDVVGANANLEPGVDVGNYPSSRILSVGLNIGF